MTILKSRGAWYGAVAAAGLALVVGILFVCENGLGGDPRGQVELDIKSDYSRIKIRKSRNVRTLWFVRDSGEEVVETMLDLDRPHDLLVDYTRFMFLSYMFRLRHEKVLIVGLGGGSMVHFLKHHDPRVQVDVVEIDPVIVDAADKYFGVSSEGNVKIHTQDAFDYLKKTKNTYDIIYMDAFLKPSASTDDTGVPLRLKTLQFYADIQKKLAEDGAVVFNINGHDGLADDVRTIRDAFAQTYVFQLPNYGGIVVVGSMAPKRESFLALQSKAAELDRRFKTSYSFRSMAARLQR